MWQPDARGKPAQGETAMRWIRFFVGTPARFVVTALVILGFVGVEGFYPGEIGTAAARLAYAVLPLIVVAIGFAIMLRAFRSQSKKKKN